MKNIVINATAVNTSGALTIFNNLLDFLRKSNDNDINYHIFTSLKKVDFVSKKITIHYVKKQSWMQRILWDHHGFNNYLKKIKVNPDLVISLQNTCSNVGDIKINQLVYYHQTLPLYDYPFNLFRIDEFKLFLYKKFYSYFVRLYSHNAYYVVQLPYIKERFLKKYKNIKSEKVFIIRPDVPDINNSVILKENIITFIYPATNLRYKNHIILLKAIKFLKDNNQINSMCFSVKFTTNDMRLQKLVKKFGVSKYVEFIGYTDPEVLFGLYKTSEALLFPSQIESFGLPLLEAAACGTRILAADLPYAREVLCDYSNVEYLSTNSEYDWAEAMLKTLVSEKRNCGLPLQKANNSGWEKFIAIAESLT